MKAVNWGWLLLFAGSLSMEISCATSPKGPDWPMYRHDNGQTGRMEGKGKISGAPETLAELDVTGIQQSFLIKHDAAEGQLKPCDVKVTTGMRGNWAAPENMYDLYGDGKLYSKSAIPGTTTTPHLIAKILKNSKGMQTITWKDFYDEKATGYMEMLDYETPGQPPRVVWHSTPLEGGVYEIILLPVDVNNDGQTDVVLATHYHIAAWDGATGKKIMEARPPIGRNYGLFGYTYVKDDLFPKFFTIVDFQSHFDVYGNDGKNFSILWREDVENPNILRVRKIIRVGPHPAVDLFGDGRKQLVFNYYDRSGDNQWHAMGFDLLTGKIVVDLPQVFIQGVTDLDGDGHEELFAKSTFGLKNKAPGELRIYKHDNNEMKPVWKLEHALWVTRPEPLENNIASIATDGSRRVMVADFAGNGLQSFFAVKPEGEKDQRVLGFTIEKDGTIKPVLNAEFKNIASLNVAGMTDVDNDKAMELRVDCVSRAPIDEVASDQHVEKMTAASNAGKMAPAIVVERKGARPLIALPTLTNEYIAAEFKNNAFHELWRRMGTGIPGPSLQMFGLGAADLDGNGKPSIIAAGKSEDWEALVQACDLDGKDKWTTRFNEFDGDAPDWNVGGLTNFFLGNYGDPKRADVLVALRRSIMHSDEAHMLDGRTGNEVWKADGAKVENGVAYGCLGSSELAADLNQDGRDEVITTYPCNYAVRNGQTGEQSVGIGIGTWAFYGDPIAYDFLKQGKPQILVTASSNYTLINGDGSQIWQTKQDKDDSAPGRVSLADLDGDGAPEICAVGFKQRKNLRAYEGKTGKLLYQSAVEGFDSAEPCVSADLNGDGRDEVLFIKENTLTAAGLKDKTVEVLWDRKFPAAIALPVVADIDGDGKLEILVSCANGKLYALGARQK